MNDPLLILAGLITGLLVGMTGMGGGSLMTPILIFLFNFNPAMAIGTDILHGAIFKSFGAWRHRVLGTVHARLTLWMLLGSAPSSVAGVGFATWLEHRYGAGFEDTVWFRMDIGRRQNADPRWILPLLCRRGHITKNEVGAIRIGANELGGRLGGTLEDPACRLLPTEAQPPPHFTPQPLSPLAHTPPGPRATPPEGSREDRHAQRFQPGR